jgi:REP element-mobilizing transposase RayT
MIRGIERRKIFLDDGDREDFLERLSKLLPQTGTACYAWVFVPNHAHFLLRTGLVPLASVMRRLLTGYAVSFNRRHKRRGHLFQNRYKSIICQEDTYLKELVRYIHLNPVRGGIVAGIRELKKYPYSGHSALMSEYERPWQDVSYVLECFGETAERARKAYLDFMEAGISQGRREDLTSGGLIRSVGGWAEVKELKRQGYEHVMSDERILGDSAFVEDLLSQAHERYERRYELKRLGYTVDRIAERVAEIYGMEPDEVLSGGKQQRKVKARSLFCYWAVRELGMSLRELAKRFGLSPPAVGYSVERGEAIAREEGYGLIGKGTLVKKQIERWLAASRLNNF